MKNHTDADVPLAFGSHTIRKESRALPWIRSLAGLFCCILMLVFVTGVTARAQGSVETARPSVNGALHVDGQVLADRNGKEVILRGLSNHGLTWFPEFVDESFFRQLSTDWDGSLIRLPMYSSIYCLNEVSKQRSLELVEKGIEAAIAADMYVIVDWHILDDYNPLMHRDEAAEFFRMISEKYGAIPNILYEICNEPNGETTWADIKNYAGEIIPIIRQNDPDSVILVGTPDYDRSLMVAALDPLPFDQVMYSLHFYAASHTDALQAELLAALDKGLPVFITECGLSEASGDGPIDLESARTWFSILKDHKLSFTVWSLCNKVESSAFFRANYEPDELISEEYLTDTGLWVRELTRGRDPQEIVLPKDPGSKTLSEKFYDLISTAGRTGMEAVGYWLSMAVFCALVSILLWAFGMRSSIKPRNSGKVKNYDDLHMRTAGAEEAPVAFPASIYSKRKFIQRIIKKQNLVRVMILISIFFTFLYINWRLMFSLPFRSGIFPVILNFILLLVEALGFAETLVHFWNMLNLRDHPLPVIGEEEYPEVDIFIATYNEPTDLLRKTINGCTHLLYPDKSKVHIWVCDDNHRQEMRELAERMGVGYFDRPDHKGAKAGNLNHALSLTGAPYIVTLDADMIPKSDFLLKTIPYFVDVEKRNLELPPEERASLGLLQTPQCFYSPDVFQHALYSERRAPNEQDFFYRSIEVAKTASNSVIYGGSNTVLARSALEAIGGFYTESITEDFATGLLIESAGFISLAIPEPLASGMTPYTFDEHIKQRTRWGRGVIVTARKLGIWRRKGLNLQQKFNYWSSTVYWYSPIKNLVYVLFPLLYAVFAIPVLRCSWLELLVYWIPMFIMQEFCLRLVSGNRINTKWSGIYETSVMPLLLLPILKELFGITLSSFAVTNKSGGGKQRRKMHLRTMLPFLILIGLSIVGIIRLFMSFHGLWSLGIVILLFWVLRNLYFLVMALFLADGRDEDGEAVHVYDAEVLTVEKEASLHERSGRYGTVKGQESIRAEAAAGKKQEGVTTHLTEHNISFYLDEGESLRIGDCVKATIMGERTDVELSGTIISERRTASGRPSVYTMEILDYTGMDAEYFQILYDRVPTLPQNLNRDLDIFRHLWVNIANRAGRVKG